MNVASWMNMGRDDVVEKFASLPGSVINGVGDTAFCYIAGSRDDRALLVAHADTVWDNRFEKVEPDLGCDAGMIFSKNPKRGIGADDRAGCSIVWEMQKMGHSLLVLTGEESGCKGSKWLMRSEEWADEIAQHSFAVQFDRRGSNDLVFYGVSTTKFEQYCNDSTPYKTAQGTYTDIVELCEKICGVNMSVGYYNEHMPKECLNLSQFNRTMQVAKDWLSKPHLPKFELPKRTSYGYGFRKSQMIGESHWDDYYNLATEPYDPTAKRTTQIPIELLEPEEPEVDIHGDQTFFPSNSKLCCYCKESSLEEELRQNGQRCIYCGATVD